ncbi:DUF7146 domain-containing protein [Gluconobacter cerinus]
MNARLGAGEVSALLSQRMDVLARELLPGGRKNGPEWMCGSVAGEKGRSLAVHLSGSKAGVWADFSTGESGDALDLVAACLTAGDTKEALKWAKNWLGVGNGDEVAIRRAHLVKEKAVRDDKQDEIDGRKRALAMWLGAEPSIGNTPVEFYLKHRGINLRVLERAPRCLRFAPGHYCNETGRRYPAMLTAISDLGGTHIATHQTWLDQDVDGNWIKARLDCPKKIRGRFVGGAIRLRKGEDGKSLKDADPEKPVLIGEGIETCLSVAVACPEMRILAAASLSNMASIALPPQVKRVTLLADNDEKPEARRGLERAIDAHLAAGREVRIARSPRGKDFNDVLK